MYYHRADLIVAPLDPPVPSFLLYVPDECHASRTRIGPYEPVAAATENYTDALYEKQHIVRQSRHMLAYHHRSPRRPAVLQCPHAQLHSQV